MLSHRCETTWSSENTWRQRNVLCIVTKRHKNKLSSSVSYDINSGKICHDVFQLLNGGKNFCTF